MKFAEVNGERREAEPSLSGVCPSCRSPVVARCGEIRVHHWAHRGKRVCDPWWENETEWHRSWKGHFPVDWQERIHISDTGEKHIADVKTVKDWVLEFQHSAINPLERRDRNAFYKKLVWVVNGLGRKRDQAQFLDTLKEIGSSNTSPLFRRIFLVQPGDSALLRDWSENPVPVFFDFGEAPVLWLLVPGNYAGKQYIIEFYRTAFIELHRNESAQTDSFANDLRDICAWALDFTQRSQAPVRQQIIPSPQLGRPRQRRPQSFQEYQALRRWGRSQRRF